MYLVNVFLTCHVSLCLLEPTGNLQIMEPQFHNSLNPSRANTTATPHALFTTFSEKKILNIYFFSYGPCTNIHQFEGCFLRGQEGSNRFIIFNGCIVEPWILLVHLKKKLENLLFSEKHCGKVFLVIKYEERLPKGAVSRNSAKLGNYKMPVLKSSFRCCLFCIKWHLPLMISLRLDKVGRHLMLYNKE